ncbi:NAD(P)H-dependent oxidoreductase [Campylobacter sp. MIT 12-5580]|uniref:NAD(P)H-dependent oxidoreductase n=1 Tax=Campylobacter sp. MIT 12-5580 TaxID=2040651 RepID=UPI001485A859|nr:NAD(P)H-dependent oxidoreductase [Campylobacter sp. MIT 12-5580]
MAKDGLCFFWYSSPALLKHWQDELFTRANGEKLSDIDTCIFSIRKSFDNEVIGALAQKSFAIFNTHTADFKLPLDEYLAYLKSF